MAIPTKNEGMYLKTQLAGNVVKTLQQFSFSHHNITCAAYSFFFIGPNSDGDEEVYSAIRNWLHQ